MPASKSIAFQPDDRQAQAIQHVHGPMLVVAGAGTGKTTVLIRRIAHLLREKHARPGEILALTYTDNAASEMRERVESELRGVDLADLQLCTFHAYCNNLLIRCGKEFGVLDDKDLWIYLRRRIRELHLNYFVRAANVPQFLDDLLDFMRRCQDEIVNPEKYLDYVRRVGCGELSIPRVSKSKNILSDEEALGRCQEIASVFATVERMLQEDNLGTFGHMITRAHDLLQQDSGLLARERQHARFILVDEFQDANFAQVKILQMLAGEDQNVFVVGDPDQAIYRFRGASSAAFGLFQRQFPEAKLVVLDKNRRSTTPILKTAYSLISHNPGAFLATGASVSYKRSPLISARDEEAEKAGKPAQNLPVEAVVVTKDAECSDIIATIRERQRKTRAPWSDFAILYRMHFHYEEIARELAEQNIPFSVENLDITDTPQVRDLTACLAVVVSTGDGTSLFRVAALPQFSVNPEKLRAAMAAVPRNAPDASLEHVLRDIENGAAVLAAVDQTRLEIERAGLKGRVAVDLIARRFDLDTTNAPIQAFLEFVSNWEKKALTKTGEIREFVEYLDDFREAGGVIVMPAREKDAVRLMTAHAAKGLEFKYVFIIRATSGSFPLAYKEGLFEFPQHLRDPDSIGEDDNKTLNDQEERRLFYVAMTRARDSLAMYAKQGRGKKDPTPPGFLRELLKDNTLRNYLRHRQASGFQTDIFAGAAPQDFLSRSSEWLSMPPAFHLNIKLSASAIDTYNTCPLQFKLERDWRLPREVSAALHYGSAMHLVLRAYYDAIRAGRPLADETVLELFRTNLAAAPIADRYQHHLYEEQGIEQLGGFLAAARRQPTPEVLHTEEPFEVRIGNTTVAGRIDRVDRADGGVVITDYKSGKPRTEEDADKSLQLSIYALAAKEKWGYHAERLAFYNLDGNAPVFTSRDEFELQSATLAVEAAAANIAAGKFEAKRGFHCNFCPYRSVCPATEKRLYNLPAAKNATGTTTEILANQAVLGSQ